ncbi:hypothetical protein DXG01_001776, partial [Tephrocybe rancida]
LSSDFCGQLRRVLSMSKLLTRNIVSEEFADNPRESNDDIREENLTIGEGAKCV